MIAGIIKTMTQETKQGLQEKLEELFPKLNEDDTSKPSSNNRSAALVLYSYACIAIDKALSSQLDGDHIKVDLKQILKDEANYNHKDFGIVASFLSSLGENKDGIVDNPREIKN